MQTGVPDIMTDALERVKADLAKHANEPDTTPLWREDWHADGSEACDVQVTCFADLRALVSELEGLRAAGTPLSAGSAPSELRLPDVTRLSEALFELDGSPRKAIAAGYRNHAERALTAIRSLLPTVPRFPASSLPTSTGSEPLNELREAILWWQGNDSWVRLWPTNGDRKNAPDREPGEDFIAFLLRSYRAARLPAPPSTTAGK